MRYSRTNAFRQPTLRANSLTLSLYNIPMTRKHLLIRALAALLLALIMVPPSAGTADTTPSIAQLIPGEGSRLTSPIAVSAEVQPDAGGLVRIELLDKKGIAISRQLLHIPGSIKKNPQPFTSELPFEIHTEETNGLLIFSILDPFLRPVALRSARVTLLSRGEPQIQPLAGGDPWINLTEPEPMDSYAGGQVPVKGTVTPLTENPLFLELIADDGRVIGTAQVRVQAAGQNFDFETVLYYYYIQSLTDARLVVRQMDNTFNTTAILDSLLISVAP